MPKRIPPMAPLLFVLLTGCGEKPVTLEDYNTRVVTFPGGAKVRAEVMMRQADMLKGMKYRDQLAPDRGMLFLHGGEGNYPYWMYEVRIPLDMLWMDKDRQVVEIYRHAEPCPGPQDKCPVYGGRERSMFVLELAGGMIDKYQLKVGQTLDF
jgi:uncharacterized protein